MKTRTLANSIMISMALLTNASFAESEVKTEVNISETVSSKEDKALPATEADAIQALVTPITEKVIIPLYKEAADQASLLNKASLSFCADPNEATLNAIREQWSLALTAWQATELALFGPALERQRDLHIYFRPVKKRVIKLLWTGDKPVNVESVNFSGVGAKGFATLEYLFADRTLSDEETLARFNSDDNTRQCEHLLAVSSLLQDDINTIYKAWTTDYPAELAETEDAMSVILGKIDQSAEAVANKLRNALAKDAHLAGKDDKREKRSAHKLEAWRGGHTLQNIQANLAGVKLALNEGGFITWLNTHKHDELANKITKQLDDMAAIEFPSKDLFQMIEDGQLEEADALFDGAMQLSRLIKEMATAMDIQLGFNDNDGD